MKLKIVLNPKQREEYLRDLLAYDGLGAVQENPKAAYCPISLTQAPEELKPYLQQRQSILMEEVLEHVGITAYDPGTAPYSPDTNLTSQPGEIYQVDSGKIAGARFFVGHNLVPSTGFGVETEKAKTLNRVVVMLMDKQMRISRMQPHRAIYLQYDNFTDVIPDLRDVFKLLMQYEPGLGFNGSVPVLLGFGQENTEVVDMEELIYTHFPHLKYEYDGAASMLKFKSINPDLFFEN